MPLKICEHIFGKFRLHFELLEPDLSKMSPNVGNKNDEFFQRQNNICIQ